MSFTIEQSFVTQFSNSVHMLSEQKMARLLSTVMVEQMSGEAKAFERIGNGDDLPNDVTTRHGDTPLNDIPHSRRWVYPKTFDYANLLDHKDQVKLLIDPKGPYVTRHAGVMGRRMDDTIIAALGGAATQGKNAETTVALPANQKIAVGGVGLTVEKLRQAKVILDEQDVPEDQERFLIYNPKQMDDLLGDDRLTSSDFNTVKALVRGEINSYMGFTFVKSNRLKVDGSGDRLLYAYLRSGVKMGVNQSPMSKATERPDKRYSWQLYTWGEWDAVRMEDELVVEIACAEN